VGEGAHTSFELSHPPTPPTLDIYTVLACKLVGCHVDFLPQPPSPHSSNLLDCTILCSSISTSTLVVNEDQAIDGVGVMQPTYAIIHDECVQKYEQEPEVKDDSLPSTPHPLYLDISCDSATFGFSCEKSSPNVSTSDHLQDTLDVQRGHIFL